MVAANDSMSAHIRMLASSSRKAITAGIVKRGIHVLVMLTMMGGLFFAAAGTLDVPRAWIYLGVSLLFFVVNLLIVVPVNPSVILARGKVSAGTKPFDKIFGVVFGLASLCVPVVAGLDSERFGWSSLPPFTLGLGMILYLISDIPIVWSMAVNPHLEKTVRIQADRGHKVVSDGPYRLVRHPMYVGGILQQLALPLIFGSLWAFVPTAVVAVSLIVRTALEDRTLRAELVGYTEYARRVPHRLCPGVW